MKSKILDLLAAVNTYVDAWIFKDYELSMLNHVILTNSYSYSQHRPLLRLSPRLSSVFQTHAECSYLGSILDLTGQSHVKEDRTDLFLVRVLLLEDS